MAFPTATSTVARTLAGPVRSHHFVSIAPSPSMLPTPTFSPLVGSHRPNRAELEECLSGAQSRAYTRRLREALGNGRPSTTATTITTTTTAPRTSRAVGSSFSSPQSDDITSTTTTTTTTTASPEVMSPLYLVAFPKAGVPYTVPCAPSPSMLPPPPATPPCPNTPRPGFPHRRSRAPPRAAVVGLGISLGVPLSFVEEDAPLTPHHVYPETLRRTPGAPLHCGCGGVEATTPELTVDSGSSYFHLPRGLVTPVGSGGSMGQREASVGLGVMGVQF
ncbi:hypothetical protein C8Q78DRAFT_1078487 [Trametes maxima]|nr:hypothetical protein C8Q78DRAFT_1078487 [Trametes maxima]